VSEVFIGHSSKDKLVADAIVKALECEGISCWIAPRDVLAGTNYGAEIIKGIRNCSILVLVFSENSNTSTAIFREVQKAFAEQKIIIPLRIQNVPVSDDLDFYISGLHWLDANPRDHNYSDLIRVVRRLLNPPKPTTAKPPAKAALKQEAPKAGKGLFGFLFNSKNTEPENFPDNVQPCATLHLLEDGEPIQEIPINKNPFVLGRNRDQADYTFESEDDKRIGRTHAVINRDGHRYYIIDKQSRNGTLLNGVKIEPDKPVPLEDGMIIRIGRRNLRFQLHD